MARRNRGGSRTVATRGSIALRTPTPQIPDISDEEMLDVPVSGQITPQEDEEDNGIGEDDEEDGTVTPLHGSEPPSRNATPVRGQTNLLPRKRKAGRPPKNRPRDWDAPDEAESRDGASDVGTPKRRGGWRGRGFGGGRWGKPRGGPSHVSQVPLDKEGNMANVKDDEVELPEDPEGEIKVDKMGNLQDNREYRVRVFTIQGKGDRLYMLSTEPARCIGFRDSYLFFQKHPTLFKIILPEEAKRDLIERNIIPHSYKGRAIGVVTARSVYREFGARIVIGGKKVVDDYHASAARASGDIEGELAVPDDRLPSTGQGYDKNRYVAWHGASSVYHSGVPTVPMQNGKPVDGKKRKVHVTGINWMYEHARESSRFNSEMTAQRRRNLTGTYEPHSNFMHYPKIMQPTHVRWEKVFTPPGSEQSFSASINKHTGSLKSIAGAKLRKITSHTDATSTGIAYRTLDPQQNGLDPYVKRNYLVMDTCYSGPPVSGLGVPGPDGEEYDIGPNGMSSASRDVLALLPEECLRPFLEARQAERKWKEKWGTEEDDCGRVDLRFAYSSAP